MKLVFVILAVLILGCALFALKQNDPLAALVIAVLGIALCLGEIHYRDQAPSA